MVSIWGSGEPWEGLEQEGTSQMFLDKDPYGLSSSPHAVQRIETLRCNGLVPFSGEIHDPLNFNHLACFYLSPSPWNK